MQPTLPAPEVLVLRRRRRASQGRAVGDDVASQPRPRAWGSQGHLRARRGTNDERHLHHAGDLDAGDLVRAIGVDRPHLSSRHARMSPPHRGTSRDK